QRRDREAHSWCCCTRTLYLAGNWVDARMQLPVTRRGPNLGWVCVYGLRDYGVVGVIVEAAPHFQQLGDGDVVAVGHTRHILRDWIVETKLAFLGEQHDHRGRHRLGIRRDPEVGVGAGWARSV